MTAYIIRRLIQLPITALGVTVLVFAMTMTLDPVERSALYVRDIPHTEGAIDAVIRRYGLDDPFHDAVLALARRPHGPRDGGDEWAASCAVTWVSPAPAAYRSWSFSSCACPRRWSLALWSVVPIIAVGVWLGILAAKNHNKLIDQGARVFALVGWSFPTFVFALLVLDDLLRQAGLVPARPSF